MKSSFFPKNERNIARIFALTLRAEILAIFRSFFGKNIKMTQINQVSRNRLHNTARSCQHLNFGLSWPGQGQNVKAKHCQSLKFSLLCTDTVLSQSSIGAQFSKQNMIKFFQCLDELAQTFNFFKLAVLRSDSKKQNYEGLTFTFLIYLVASHCKNIVK